MTATDAAPTGAADFIVDPQGQRIDAVPGSDLRPRADLRRFRLGPNRPQPAPGQTDALSAFANADASSYSPGEAKVLARVVLAAVDVYGLGWDGQGEWQAVVLDGTEEVAAIAALVHRGVLEDA